MVEIYPNFHKIKYQYDDHKGLIMNQIHFNSNIIKVKTREDTILASFKKNGDYKKIEEFFIKIDNNN